jgi:hypothetical protein
VAGLISPSLIRIIVHIYVPSVLMGFGLGMLLPTLPILARSFGVAPEVAAQAVTALLVGRTARSFRVATSWTGSGAAWRWQPVRWW